jgi:hypothetical protein
MLGIANGRSSEEQTQEGCADDADSFHLVLFLSSALGALTLRPFASGFIDSTADSTAEASTP